MKNSMPTMYASAERVDEEEISLATNLLRTAGLIDHVTNSLPSVILILNEHRQVVFSNKRILEFLGINNEKEILGKRPGEILDCIHACETNGGCGTTEFCRQCGAVVSILESQKTGNTSVKVCRVLTTTNKAYEFRVWSSPYTYSQNYFTIFSLVDMRDEMRREALQKTFFHDVNNILMAIDCSLQLIDDTGLPSGILNQIGSLKIASKMLVEEISSQKRLLKAENKELNVKITRFNSIILFNEVIKLFIENLLWSNRIMIVDDDSQSFEIETDMAILFRVVCNMLRNSLEASNEEEVITLRCHKKDGNAVLSVHNPNYMERAVQLQVFHRSFSTKGKGRGLGTYSMKLFVEKYLNGRVWFESDEQTGTIFYVSIPLHL